MRPRTSNRFFCLLALVVMSGPAYAGGGSSVFMEDLTWMEVKARIQGGATTAIIPTGGTEQSGPQLVTGKHNIIARFEAGEIAKRLGNALVAPVIPYTPSGRIEPAEGHMLFAGTISLSERTFALVLEDTARSLKQHGFRVICFIGDHSGAQATQAMVAEKLNDEWSIQGVKVVNVSDYYGHNGHEEWSEQMGIKTPNPAAHAGLIETSELMTIDAPGVRDTMRGNYSERDYRSTGAMGDSTQASVNYGRRFLSLKVEAAVNQIQNATYGTQ